MKIPNQIPICNNIWSVTYTEKLRSEDGEEACGLCNKAEKTIYLDSELKGQELNKTFLHELFHSITYEYSINQGALSADLEEIICDVYANYLVDHFYIKAKPKILEGE